MRQPTLRTPDTSRLIPVILLALSFSPVAYAGYDFSNPAYRVQNTPKPQAVVAAPSSAPVITFNTASMDASAPASTSASTPAVTSASAPVVDASPITLVRQEPPRMVDPVITPTSPSTAAAASVALDNRQQLQSARDYEALRNKLGVAKQQPPSKMAYIGPLVGLLFAAFIIYMVTTRMFRERPVDDSRMPWQRPARRPSVDTHAHLRSGLLPVDADAPGSPVTSAAASIPDQRSSAHPLFAAGETYTKINPLGSTQPAIISGAPQPEGASAQAVPLNQEVSKHLAAFLAGHPLLPMAYATMLHELELDYSAASLARIDVFLGQLRSQMNPDAEVWLQDPDRVYFMTVLAFYLGTTIARLTGQSAAWYSDTGMQKLLNNPDYPKTFGSKYNCMLGGTKLYVPMHEIFCLLFDDQPARSCTDTLAAMQQAHPQ